MFREGFPEEATFGPSLEGRVGVHNRWKQREEHLKGRKQLVQSCQSSKSCPPQMEGKNMKPQTELWEPISPRSYKVLKIPEHRP